MAFSLRRPGALLLALAALAACAKQQPLPVASFTLTAGVQVDANGNPALTVATGQQILLDGSGSTDPAGGTLAFRWSFLQLPRGSRATIESPTSAKTRFTADVPTSVQEKYVLQLVVSTKYFDSVPQTITINALECGANVPQIASITAAPTSINVATPVLLTASVDDKDNDAQCQPSLGNKLQPLTYTWTLIALPPGSKAHLRDAHAVLGAFDPDVPGTYTASLVVTDSTRLSSPVSKLDVVVQPCGGAAPGIDAMQSSPTSPNLDQPTQLSASVSDADNLTGCGLNQGATYAWSIVALPAGSLASLNDPKAVNPSFTPDLPGTYRFSLVVTDTTHRASAPRTLDVVAKNCGGSPPTPVVQFAPASAGVGTPISLQVAPDDADQACGVSETFSYAWSLLTVPGGSRAQISGANASQASLTPDVGGDYAIAVTIVDSSGTRASAVNHLTVATCGRNAPSVDALVGLPITPLVGQDVIVTPQVSDADSSCAGYNGTQTFAWTLTQRPPSSAAALKDPAARQADFVPDVPGTYQATLVVTDFTGLSSAPASFTVQTATCGNAPPQIVAVGASNASPDPGSTITLFAQATDADNSGACNLGQSISLLWAVVSRPAGSSATLSDPAAPNGRPTFTPDAAGSYQFSVVATDSTGLRSAPAFKTITTTSCGTAAPTVSVQPASAAVQPFQPVPLSATPFDADTSCGISETFTYAWQLVSAPAGSDAMFSNPSLAAPSFTPDLAGSYLLSATVSDSHGRTSPPAFVTVTASSCASLPPVTGALSAGAPVLGSPIALSAPLAHAVACGSAASLTYDWSLSGRPLASTAAIDNPAAAAPKFTPDVAGVYQVTLVVTDSRGQRSAPGFVNLTVAPCGTSLLAWNPAPELSPSFQEPDGSAASTPAFAGGAWTGAFVGTRVTMAAGFTDPPGCGTAGVTPYTWQWAIVSRPAGSAAQLDSSSGATPGFVPDLPGDYQLAARVGDAMGAVLPTRFTVVRVANCGFNLPVVSIAGPVSANTFQPIALQVAGAGATDADNACPNRFHVTGFSYAWSVSPAGASLLPMAGANTTFTAQSPGTYTVSLVATASNGVASAPATQTVAVGNCGSHPPAISQVTTTVAGSAASRPQIGQSVTVTAFATDQDSTCGDTVVEYDWTLASAPAGSAVTAPAPGASFSFTPDRAGSFDFTVTAVDSFGLRSAPYTVSVATSVCSPATPVITPSTLAPAINQQITLTAAPPADSCVASPAFAWTWTVLSAPRGSLAALSATTGASVKFTPDVAGAYAFGVVATDQGGFASGPATAQVDAGTCATNPPLLAAIQSSPAVPDAGEVVTLSSALTDLNAACGALTQPYRWSWTLLSRPAGSAATLESTAAAPSFVPDVPGSYQISAQVTDALGNTSALVFTTLTTSACGRNPVVASIAPAGSPQVPALAGSPLSLSATVSDADNSCVDPRFHVTLAQQWSVLTAPAGAHATLSSTSAGATQFTGDLPGTYVVGLVGTASNGVKSALVADSILVGACGANPPSVISVSASASRPQPGANFSLTANVFDQDNAGGPGCPNQNQTFTYAWRAVSTPAGASLDTSTTGKTLSFTPGAAGTYLIEVVATDSTGRSSAPFRTSVSTGACGPTLGVVNVVGSLQTGVTLGTSLQQLSDACVMGGGTPNFFWSLASRPFTSSAGFVDPTLASNSFTPDVPGSYDVRVTVTDSGGFSSSADAVVQVGGCSAPPAVAINAPRTFDPVAGEVTPRLDRGDSVALSATVSGAACGASAPSYSYTWALIGLPPGSASQLTDPHAANPSFVADVANGTWQISLLVTDAVGNATTQFAAVTTSGCGAQKPQPVVSAAPPNPNTFASSVLTVTNPTADPEAACLPRFRTALPLSFAWSVASKPSGAPDPTFAASAASATLTPKFPGAYQVQLVATGADGVAGDPVLTTVTAGACGFNAPVIGAVLGAVQAGGAAAAPFDQRLDVALSASVSDINGACGAAPHTASQHWTLTSVPAGSLALLAAADTASPHFIPDRPGTYALQLTATDNFGLSSSQAFTLAVGNCGGNAPVVSPFGARQTLSATSVLTDPAHMALGFPVVANAPSVDDLDWHAATCTPTLPTGVAYAWTLLPAAGSHAVLSNAASAQPSFVPDVLGTYTLAVVATDTTGLSSQPQALAVTATCGAAGPVPGKLTATQVVPALSTSAGPVTNFTITRTSDGAGQLNANVPFYPGEGVALSAPVTDADVTACGFPETVTYAWSLSAAPAGSIAFINQPASPTPSFVPDLPGEYDLQLTVTDSTGHANTQVYGQFAGSPVVGVSDCGLNPPTASVSLTAPASIPGPFTAVALPVGSATSLLATVNDVDEQTLNLTPTPAQGCGLSESFSYAWSMTARPTTSTAALTQANRANPSLTLDLAGTYGLRLQTTDAVRSSTVDVSLLAATASGTASTLVASAAHVTVGTPVTLTVTVNDGAVPAHPIAAVPVQFSSDGSTNVFAPVSGSGVTDLNGQLQVTLTSTKAELKHVTALVGGTIGLGPITVTFDPAAATRIVVGTDFPSPAATFNSTETIPDSLVFNAVDQFGNLDTSYSGAVSLAFGTVSSGPGTGCSSSTLTVNGIGTNPPLSAFSGGVADYSGALVVDTGTATPCNGFTLTATSGTFNATSSAFNMRIRPTPPLPPTNMTAAASINSGNNVVALTWTKTTDPTVAKFFIYRKAGAAPTPGVDTPVITITPSGANCPNKQNDVTACSTTDNGSVAQGPLLSSTVYFYAVTAANVANNESTPATANTTTAPTAPPDFAGTIQYSGTGTATIQFTFSSDGLPTTSYTLKRVTPGASDISNFTSGQADPRTLTFGNSYTYALQASDAAGSRTTPQITLTLRPATPTGINFPGPDFADVNLTWNNDNGATSFAVSRSTSLTGPFTAVGTSATNSFTDTTVAAGSTYFYEVSATNSSASTGCVALSGTCTTSPNSSAQPPAGVTVPAAPAWTGVTTGLFGGSALSLAQAGASGAFFAGTGNQGVWTSTNTSGGAAWTAFNSGLSTQAVQALAVDVAGSLVFAGTPTGGVFSSSITTAGWTAANGTAAGTVLANLNVRALAYDASSGKLFAGTGAGLFVSSDLGATTWTPVAASTVTGSVSALFVVSGGLRIYVGSGTQIFETTNGGGDMAALHDFSPAAVDSLAANPGAASNGSQDSVYVGTSNGVFVSNNNNGDHFGTAQRSGHVFTSLAIDVTNNRLFGGEDVGAASVATPSTTSTSLTFSVVSNGLPCNVASNACPTSPAAGAIGALFVTPGSDANHDTLLAATSNGSVFRANNNSGSNWGATSGIPFAIKGMTAGLEGSNQSMEMAITNENVFRLKHGQSSWSLELVPANNGVNAITANPSSGRVYVGLNWNGTANAATINFTNSTPSWAFFQTIAGDNVTAAVNDGSATPDTYFGTAASFITVCTGAVPAANGSNCSAFSAGGLNTNIHALALDSALNAYAGNDTGLIVLSSGTWIADPITGGPSTPVRSLAVATVPAGVYPTESGTVIYAGTDSNVQRRDTAWTTLTGLTLTGSAQALLVDPTHVSHLMVGTGGNGIQRSPDFGATFYDFSGGLPASSSVTAMTVSPIAGPNLYCGTSTGTAATNAN